MLVHDWVEFSAKRPHLAQKFGDNRVFNTPIQEAFIVGSTVGMSAVGLKPIVEVQFADYIWPGLNQLFTEVARSCYLTNGKWPVSMILRVPIGAYGSGGPTIHPQWKVF
jgi:2-oxoisovalerate dehydrogenase E1 component